MNLKKRIEKLEKKHLSDKCEIRGSFIIPSKLNISDEQLAILELEDSIFIETLKKYESKKHDE